MIEWPAYRDEKCMTCGNSREWHQENKPIHPFNNGEAGATAFLGARRDRDGKTPQRGSETPPPVAFPFDPVLRQALIDKGVITADELRDAESKIRVVTGMFHQAVEKREVSND